MVDALSIVRFRSAIKETMDIAFLFWAISDGDDLENYSVISGGVIYKNTNDEDLEKVVDMIKNLNEGTNLEEYLDVEGILKYFVANIFLVNLDSYSGGMYHNYYLYEKGGKFTIIPWDLNLSFAGHNLNSSERAINFPIDSPVTGTLESAPLIGKLLEVEEYKEMYHGYLEEIVNDYINSGVFNKTVIKIDKLIADYVKIDATTFYTYEEFKNSIPEILTFVEDRANSIEAQLLGTQYSETYGNMATKLNLTSLGSMGMGNKGDKKNKGEVSNLENKNDVAALNMNNIKPDDMRSDKMNLENMQDISMKNYVIEILISVVIIIFGLIFSYKFRRKRHRI